MNSFGPNMKKIRKSKSITLKELAEYIGVTEATVQRYESGEISNVPYEKIVLISEALRVSPNKLMGWDTPKDIPEYVPGTVEIIDLFSRATPEQREAVLSLLRSFVNNK